jgi:hypothetical protein
MKTLVTGAVALLLALTTSAQQPAPLRQQERDALLYMREEEKSARDIYDSIFTRWGGKPFDNIRKSEQTHMDRLQTLIATYQLSDPVAATQDKRGKFINADLQKLYDSLISKSSRSYAEALRTGTYVEELDILDLEARIKQTQHEDIITVYNCLLHASEQHLRAFTQHLKKQGIAYKPVLLDNARFDAILADSNTGCPM